MARVPLVLDKRSITVEFYVLDSLVFDCLLGFQFCKEQQLIIDLTTNTVKVYKPDRDVTCAVLSKDYTMVDGKEQPVLSAAEEVTLEPFTERLVCTSDVGQSGASYHADNGQDMLKDGLYFSNSLRRDKAKYCGREYD